MGLRVVSVAVHNKQAPCRRVGGARPPSGQHRPQLPDVRGEIRGELGQARILRCEPRKPLRAAGFDRLVHTHGIPAP